MTRRHWIILAVLLALAVLVAAGLGAVFLVKNVPGIARLVYGDPPTPTPREPSTAFLPTVTLTPEPPQPTETPMPPPTATAIQEESTAEPTSPHTLASFTPISELPTATPELPTATPPPPTAIPRPEWIVFETRRGSLGDYEIFVMAPDGSRVSNLTNSWADDVAPVWSPDGRRIAFVSFRDTQLGKSGGPEDGSIYIMDFDPMAGISEGNVVRLTGEGGHDGWPTWSPDGKRIAFHSNRGGSWDIWVINIDGSGLRNLTNQPVADRYASWSPDGKKIAFTSGRSGNEEIWVMNADGSAPASLTNAPARDRYPFWSPDGRQLTFNSKRDGNFEVYLMNADGSNPRNVSQSPQSAEGLADWSPDGKRLVFYSDRPGNKDVFVLDLASGRWTNITNDPANDEFCTWSP